jgi:protein-disulfide isomerase
MFQLFQLLASQVESLQSEVKELRAELEKSKSQPKRPSRPTRPRPDSTSIYSISVVGAPSRGSRRPLVTIVKGFEFACVYCNKARPTLDQLLKDYRGDLRIVYKHFIVHPSTATEPAMAACAAGKQGKWQKMSTLIWDEFNGKRDLSEAMMTKLARRAKVKMAQYRIDRDGDCKELVRRDHAELAAVGTTGTPAFYINGRFLSGARPIDQFKKVIDEELAKAQKRIRADSSLNRSNYYAREVTGKGLKKLAPVP